MDYNPNDNELETQEIEAIVGYEETLDLEPNLDDYDKRIVVNNCGGLIALEVYKDDAYQTEDYQYCYITMTVEQARELMSIIGKAIQDLEV